MPKRPAKEGESNLSSTRRIEVVHVPISKLVFAEYNPRKATEKEYGDLKKSIEKYGMIDPLIVNSAPKRKNIIIGGHFRARVAKDMGIKEVPVVYLSIPELEREQELNIRLNKNTGSWDFSMLANFDEKLLNESGFTEEDFERIFKKEKNSDSGESPGTDHIDKYVTVEFASQEELDSAEKRLGLTKMNRNIKWKDLVEKLQPQKTEQ